MTQQLAHVFGWLCCVLGLPASYLVSCLRYPKTRCWVCKKTPGRRVSSSGRNWGDCWWCGGKGHRLRYGKRIYDWLTGRSK